MQETEGRVYQQVEIETGPFRRIVRLSADVDAERARATYEDGVLRVELPLRAGGEETRQVPIDRAWRSRWLSIEVVESPTSTRRSASARDQPLPAALPVLPARATSSPTRRR